MTDTADRVPKLPLESLRKRAEGNISETSIPPDFQGLLKSPVVDDQLPNDLNIEKEAAHLLELWKQSSKFRDYEIISFVFAGGSGLVFKVRPRAESGVWALKVAREKKLAEIQKSTGTGGGSQRPSLLSDREIAALQRVSHPNVVRFRETLELPKLGAFALITSYVDGGESLDAYLRKVLLKNPVRHSAFSIERIDNAARFLIDRFIEMADALAHMHERGLFHCDVKPANILVDSSNRNFPANLTDLGACVAAEDIDPNHIHNVRVEFTWTYAHPDLRDLKNNPGGLTGGGLKSHADLASTYAFAKIDLFALGRSMQECLAVLEEEYGERCFSSYNFRFLHLVACLLLDGHNAPGSDKTERRDSRRFVGDLAMDYPVDLFTRHKISTARDLTDRLQRIGRDTSWSKIIPELDVWQPDIINTGIGDPVPFTNRVATLFGHPIVRRLRHELQLGWIREVYPGATHSRWSHTIGVFSNLVQSYSALLSDPEMPTARVLLDPKDVEHGLIAGIIHDLGQTAFGHDLEAAVPELFKHERIISKLLDERRATVLTSRERTQVAREPIKSLRETIEDTWNGVKCDRVLKILGHQSRDGSALETGLDSPVDGLAKDLIDGPIDSDKLDYLIRDSVYCGVPYGNGIDRPRFLRALTCDARQLSHDQSRLALAYRAKGASAIEGLLVARYQLYGAVYWHHAFRCVQAMFVHAAAATFSPYIVEKRDDRAFIDSYFYDRVICGLSMNQWRRHFDASSGGIPKNVTNDPPQMVTAEPALEFVWRFADQRNRHLIERLARRALFKRVYEIRCGEISNPVDYSALCGKFAPRSRNEYAVALEGYFRDAILKRMNEKGPTESFSESEARQRIQALSNDDEPRIVIDFPIRGIPDERNKPREFGDPSRKYISGRSQTPATSRNVFGQVRQMQIEIASLRVFVAPELHELVTRYLGPRQVQACVEQAMPFLRTYS